MIMTGRRGKAAPSAGAMPRRLGGRYVALAALKR